MEAIEARRKAQDEKDAAHAKEKFEEEASIAKAIRSIELQTKIETLKHTRTKLRAQLKEKRDRIDASEAILRAQQQEHDSRVKLIETHFEGSESELLRVDSAITDQEAENDSLNAPSTNDDPHRGDQSLVTQPRRDGMVSTTEHRLVGNSDDGSGTLVDSESTTRGNQADPSTASFVPDMQSTGTPSSATGQVHNASSAARARQPTEHGRTYSAPSSSGPSIATARGTFLEKCPMIHQHGNKYYEIGCPKLECRQNASKQVGFFKGLTGLKKHVNHHHKEIIAWGLGICIIHEFDDVDCKRLREGKDPVSRTLPAKITAPVLGLAAQRSASETDALEPEVARTFERNVAGTTEAFMTPSREIAPMANTLTKNSAAEDLQGSIAPPKQSPRTPIVGAAPVKPRRFDNASDVVDYLTSGKKVREGNEGDTPTKMRLGAGMSTSLQTRQGASPMAVLESVKRAGQSKEVIATGKIIPSPSDAGTTATPVRSPPRDPRRQNRAGHVQGISVINEINSPAAKSSMTAPNKATIQTKGTSKNTPTGPSQQHPNGNGASNHSANGLAQHRSNRNVTPDRTPTEPRAQQFDAIGTFDRTPGGTSQLRPSGYGSASHEAPPRSSRQAPRNVPRRGGEGRLTRGRGDSYRPSSSLAGRNAEKQSESRRM